MAGMYVSNRNINIRTKSGNAYSFVKGEPVYVVPQAREEVLSKGIIPVDESELPNEDEAPAVKPEPAGPDRETLIRRGIEALIAKNRAGDFDAANKPTIDALHNVVGFKPTKRERDAVLDKMTAERSE